MTKLEAIVRDAHSLSPQELAQLLALLEQRVSSSGTYEFLAGQRGLASWTESAGGEDWSEFYPEALRNGRSPKA